MISISLREQKRYTQKDLCKNLECSESLVIPIIRKLKEFGILKAVKATDTQKDLSDLIDEDVELADVAAGESDFFYVFSFVGIIIVGGRVLKIYPKYLLKSNCPDNQFRQLLKVLEKYNSKKQIIRVFNDSDEGSSFNLLAVLLFLLQDYFENGVYNQTEESIESNGSGEILWDKTINETFTFLSNNRPYYIDIQTKKRTTNEFDYFTRLHECVLTLASRELKEAGLLDLFEIPDVEISEENLDDFGDQDYILYRIETELNTQFNTRKQLVLKTLFAYIAHKGSLYDIDCFSLFGTNRFNLVWEDICAEIMDNQLNSTLESIKLPTSLKPEYSPKYRLIDLIEKPLWSITEKTAHDTLIPDIIAIDGNQFIIIDAKYYNTRLVKGAEPKGQPGIDSITKQYLYQLAYQKFIREHDFDYIKNCFLLPTENDSIENGGEVSLDMLHDLKLQNIQVRFLPAAYVYSCYLADKKISTELLFL